MKEKAWEVEFARKCQPVKPVCIGCCWASNGTEASRNVLMQYQAVPFTSSPITINFNQQEKTTLDVTTTPKTDKPACELWCVYIGVCAKHTCMYMFKCAWNCSEHAKDVL